MALLGRPKRKDKDNATASAAEKGTIPGDVRKTFIVKDSDAKKIDHISYIDRKTIKEVVAEAFENYISKWEAKNGKIKLPK